MAAAVLFASCLCVFSCSDEVYTDRVIKGTDTYVTLRMSERSSTGAKLSRDYYDEVVGGCARLVSKCDELMSPTLETSHINALNNKVDMIVSPDESLIAVLRTASDISSLTGGAYSFSLGALNSVWKDGGEPSDEDIKTALENISADELTVSEEKIEFASKDVKLDLSSISEGFTAQRVLEYLSAAELAYGVVSVGNSVGVFGDKGGEDGFKIGVKDPENTESVLAYYSIAGGFLSVACVGDGELILDASTGRYADSGVVCAAVVSANGAVSDALSYALVVMGEEKTSELYESGSLSFEAILINEEKEVLVTRGIDKEALEILKKEYTVREIGT